MADQSYEDWLTQQLEEDGVPEEPTPHADRASTAQYDTLEQFNAAIIGDLGFDTPEPVNNSGKPIKAEVHGPGLEEPIAAEETFFSINFLERVDLNAVDVEIFGPSPPKAQMFKTSDSSVDISYSVEMPGDYEIDIYVGDTIVENCPFKVKMLSKEEEMQMLAAFNNMAIEPEPQEDPLAMFDMNTASEEGAVIGQLIDMLGSVQERWQDLVKQTAGQEHAEEIRQVEDNIKNIREMAAMQANSAPQLNTQAYNSAPTASKSRPQHQSPQLHRVASNPVGNSQMQQSHSDSMIREPRNKAQEKSQEKSQRTPSYESKPKKRSSPVTAQHKQQHTSGIKGSSKSGASATGGRKESAKAEKEITIYFADGSRQPFTVRNTLTANALKFQILKKKGIPAKDFEAYGLFSTTDQRNEVEVTERMRPYNIQLQNGWSSSHRFIFRRINKKKNKKKKDKKKR